MLLCPICQTELRRTEKQMKCENGHSFDLARQGYVNLMINGKKSSGDDRDMVKSRHLFLEEGFYAPLRDHVSNLIASRKPQVLVDAGCGEGYYTKVCAQHAREAYGFDLSKAALKLAAANDAKTHYAIASLAHLPLADESVDVLLSVFAPFDEAEFQRVLKADGLLIQVQPGPYHLYELKQILYERVQLHEPTVHSRSFDVVKAETLAYPMEIHDPQHLQALFQMTPYYWKSPKESRSRLQAQSVLQVRASFHIVCYRKQVKK